ncbi:C-terminal helicase domain-containing protein [Glutamicibacter arilaitensis]|uniref:TrwC relaxase domain-containing protein n=2 Tax=Glutamicibacter arilaitensis TaxID=256701 RepID=A0A2N7RY65_9MICC|nr:helicase C-terminal domain-containing protein [Glutamicibacter arilaitensis]PMQ18839.1 hypothetical protein CIK84_15745 [Glutamicibacter arilaitensis]
MGLGNLGYADTVHSAQGATVDTAHALLTKSTDRAGAYVATSRGKYDNRIYVGLAGGDRADTVLNGIAERTDLNLTAHETVTREFEQARDINSLGMIYRDLVDQAQSAKYEQILRTTLSTPIAQPILEDPAWGAVSRHLERAEEAGVKLETLIEDAYSQHDFTEADSIAAILAWRMDTLLENREATLTTAERPLREVNQDHLLALKERALDRSEAAGSSSRKSAVELAEAEKISPLTRRLYGHLGDEELAARIKHTDNELIRQIPSDVDNNEAYLSWSLGKLRHEQQLRQDMPEPLAQAEIRGREHRTLAGTSGTVLRRISTELKLRELEQTPFEQPREPNRLGEWFAPRTQLADPRLPAAWKEQIEAYRPVVDAEHQRLGAELAQNPPAWLEDLGPVPGRADRAEEWRRLAAEIATYRRTYNIPNSEPTLLPTQHLKDNPVAQHLRNRAAELHKHSELTTRKPMPDDAKEQLTQQKADEAGTAVHQSDAAAKIAALRQRAQTRNETTPQEKENAMSTSENHAGQERSGAAETNELLARLRKTQEAQQQAADQQRKLKDDEAQRRGPSGPTLR